MSTKRPVSTELLHAWVDGEAGERAAEVSEAVAADPVMAAEADNVRRLGGAVRGLVDDGLGPVDPLVALTRIRARIAERKERSVAARLSAWWTDVTTFNRRAFAGVAVAMGLGAVSAPAVVWFSGRAGGGSPEVMTVPAVDNASYVTSAETPVALMVRLVTVRDSGVDDRLKGIVSALERPGAGGFALAGETVVRAEPGSVTRIELPSGGALVVRPLGTFSGAYRVDVDVDAHDLHTTVNLAPGATGTVDAGGVIVAITREASR